MKKSLIINLRYVKAGLWAFFVSFFATKKMRGRKRGVKIGLGSENETQRVSHPINYIKVGKKGVDENGRRYVEHTPEQMEYLFRRYNIR